MYCLTGYSCFTDFVTILQSAISTLIFCNLFSLLQFVFAFYRPPLLQTLVGLMVSRHGSFLPSTGPSGMNHLMTSTPPIMKSLDSQNSSAYNQWTESSGHVLCWVNGIKVSAYFHVPWSDSLVLQVACRVAWCTLIGVVHAWTSGIM